MKYINKWLIIIFIPFALIAQKDFEKGYIVTLENDTISGMIKDRKGGSFPKLYDKVYFKRKGHRKKKYGPDKILSYQRGENKYESIWFQDHGIPFMGFYASKENLGEKVFFQVIQKGYLSYYHLEFIHSDSGYIDATTFFKKDDAQSFVQVYQGIFGLKKKALAKYLKDYPELAEKIENGEIKNAFEVLNDYNSWREQN